METLTTIETRDRGQTIRFAVEQEIFRLPLGGLWRNTALVVARVKINPDRNDSEECIASYSLRSDGRGADRFKRYSYVSEQANTVSAKSASFEVFADIGQMPELAREPGEPLAAHVERCEKLLADRSGSAS